MNLQNKFKQMRKQLLVFLAHEIALPYFKWFRKSYYFPYSVTQLSNGTKASVGHELFLFFQHNHLQMLPHYENHDIQHVVLGYLPTEAGEVGLQCFMLACGRITLPVLFSVIVGLLIMPERWSAFARAWKRGRRTRSLNKLDWFQLIQQPLAEVRAHISNLQIK